MQHQPVQGDAPQQSHKLLRRVLPKFLHPYARSVRKRALAFGRAESEPFRSVAPFTQVSRARQQSILDKANDLVALAVPGDFVECGVLDGGTAALLAVAAAKDNRKVHLFDAWRGLPPATEQDGPGAEQWAGDVVGSPHRVRSVLRKVGASMSDVELHEGWFEVTLPTATINQVAFLHIDCDFYESTLLVLHHFYDKISLGGCVQIDDYTSFEGCRRAVNEFISMKNNIDLLVDETPGGPIYFYKRA